MNRHIWEIFTIAARQKIEHNFDLSKQLLQQAKYYDELLGGRIMEDFKSINVTKGVKTLEINNPTNYPLIGMGAQGAVFKLSEDRCIKIYSDRYKQKWRKKLLKLANIYPLCLDSMSSGSNYIVIEYFNAPTLKEYITKLYVYS